VAWVNVFDPNDFVTGGQGLSDKAAGVRDISVDNGKTPHAAVNYLSQEGVAQTVHAGTRVCPASGGTSVSGGWW
jgi:hypothetical protein